jgi:predicted dehydrogenase
MIRLGVIGHGGRVSSFINQYLRDSAPGVQVVGIVDPDEPAARGRLPEPDRYTATFHPDLDDLVRRAKPDALVIGTRCNLHSPYAIQAAAYDLPLFLEKPVAVNMEQAIALEAAFEHSRCVAEVSFPLRVSPLCEMARDRIARGEIGEPQHVLATNYVPYGTVYFDQFYRDYSVTQGLFVQKGTHDLDYLMYLMGSPITRVSAMGTYGRIFGGSRAAGLVCSACPEAATCPESPAARQRNLSGGTTEDHACVFGIDIGTPETGMNEDSSSALLEFANGSHGAYVQVFYTRRDAATRGATVSGYQGTLSFDWYTNSLSLVRHHRPFSDKCEGDKGASHFGGDAELARDFVALVCEGKPPRTTIWHGLQSIYACLAAKESAEQGHFVDVRQVGVREPQG